MARLRYNGLTATLGADLLTAGTTITFSAALTHAAGNVPTITGSDYIPLAILDTTGKPVEIVHLTAYTSGATTGTVTRAQESTTAADRATGLKVINGLTVADITELGGSGGVGALAWRSTAQAIATGTNTAISFDSEGFDQGGLYNPAQPTRLTIQEAGLYDLTGQLRYDGSSTGVRGANIRKNGTTYICGTALPNAGAGPTSIQVCGAAQLAVGDYLELVAYHEAGASLSTNVSGTNVYTWLSALKVGGTTGGGSGGSAATTTFTPAGNIAATDVQAAITELDTEKAATAHTHAASAITYAGSTNLTATDVEAALDELDAEKKSLTVDGCQILPASDVTVANLTNVIIPGGTENYDTAGYHDLVTNNSRVTIPTGKAGKYLLHGAIRYSANATGSRDLSFAKNGVVLGGGGYVTLPAVAGGGITILSHSVVISLAVGDYIEMWAYQNSGSSLTIPGGWAALTVTYLGA